MEGAQRQLSHMDAVRRIDAREHRPFAARPRCPHAGMPCRRTSQRTGRASSRRSSTGIATAVHVAVAMVRKGHSAMQHAVTTPRMSDWECIMMLRVSVLTPARTLRVVLCACGGAQRSDSPLALSCLLTPPPIAIHFERRQCVCMEAQPMPSHASLAPSNLPPCDQQRITLHSAQRSGYPLGPTGARVASSSELQRRATQLGVQRDSTMPARPQRGARVVPAPPSCS